MPGARRSGSSGWSLRGKRMPRRSRNRDAAAFGRAVALLEPHGVPIEVACALFAESLEAVGDAVLVPIAAKEYAQRHAGLVERSVAEAVDEFRAEKKAAGLSPTYLADIDYRLGAFAAAFKSPVDSIAPEAVRLFVEARKLSPRGINNFRGMLASFFAFCRKRRYLDRDADPLTQTDKRRQRGGTIEIFTPQEGAALLTAASPEFRVCLALQMFAGCRAEEVLRLEWKDLDRRPGFVEIGASKSKTASRRLVPIIPTLARWIDRAPRNGERVWRHSKPFFFEEQRNASRRAAVPWKSNAPRHSFISYRLAVMPDVARVALEAGNSPQMIFRNYRELATPSEAQAWFEIAPSAPGNVVSMPRAATG